MSDLTDLENLLNGTDAGSGQSSDGKGLRAQLEAVLAERKALQEQLAQVQATQREGAVASLFAKHSIPELARDFFPKDGDLNDEAATAFVAKYGQLWGAQAATATTPPADQAAANAIQSFAAQAQTAPASPLSEDEYRAKFAEAKTKAEFLQILSEVEATATAGE